MVIKTSRIDPKTDPEVHARITGRYSKFLENLGDPAKPIVRVFDPLSKRQVEEIETIRECSRMLQQKKEDDLRKAKELAEEAKQAAIEAKKQEKVSKEGAEQKTETENAENVEGAENKEAVVPTEEKKQE